MTEKIKISSGQFHSYDIPLGVGESFPPDANAPKSLRIGEFAGSSSAILFVQQVEEIDFLMDRLLDIRQDLLSKS